MLKSSLILFSAVSFIGFGMACFFSSYMKHEFERYGLGSERVLVGILQVCGGIGLLAGINRPWIGQAAAGGLSLMMLAGIAVRIHIKDTKLQMVPAVVYMLLNAYLCLAGF